jgi:hypothetical protein
MHAKILLEVLTILPFINLSFNYVVYYRECL